MFFDRIREDIDCVFANDPAAKNALEVLTTYPGLHALWMHRAARLLYGKRYFTLARMVSHLGRFLTGIEIHPGATIGRRVFIDHGMGIVIGETSEIGDECLLYKGVVLGGTSLAKKKRHPTLGKGVVVGSNACILGAITIGDGARVGSGSVVVKDVPAGATVVGIPGKVVRHSTASAEVCPDGGIDDKLQHADLPDPLIEILKSWTGLLERYEERIKTLEAHHNITSEDLAKAFKKEMPFLDDNNSGPSETEAETKADGKD